MAEHPEVSSDPKDWVYEKRWGAQGLWWPHPTEAGLELFWRFQGAKVAFKGAAGASLQCTETWKCTGLTRPLAAEDTPAPSTRAASTQFPELQDSTKKRKAASSTQVPELEDDDDQLGPEDATSSSDKESYSFLDESKRKTDKDDKEAKDIEQPAPKRLKTDKDDKEAKDIEQPA